MPVSMLPSVANSGFVQRFYSGERAIPRVLSTIGLILALVVIAEWTVFARLQPALILNPMNVAGLVSSTPFILGLIYGGHWLRRSDLPRDRYPRIAGWTVGALFVFLLMNILSVVATAPESRWVVVGWLRWAAGIGSGVGLVIGTIEARAIERERAAERAAARADYIESQHDWLDYLNSLLRHEILNTANVIIGATTRLTEEHDPDDSIEAQIETIDRQTRTMTTVIQDVRAILRSSRDPIALEPVDLGAILRDEIATLEARDRTVEVDLSIPDDGVVVQADDLLSRVFANLLANAVEHNDNPRPRVQVAVETTPDVARIRITDNGPGIPEEVVDTLFERKRATGRSHQLGLYLVDTLIERYDGAITLTDTGEDGTTFTVELPRARASTPESAGKETINVAGPQPNNPES